MSVLTQFTVGAAGFAFGLFLTGCNTADSNSANPEDRSPIGTTDLTGSSDFDRDLIAAKRGKAGTAEGLRAIEAVLTRYGVPYLPLNPPVEQFEPIASPAAKAAVFTFSTTVRNFTADNDIHTFYKDVTVKAGKTLTVEAVGTAATADPYLVAFYPDGVSGTETGYSVKFVAAHDDISNENRNSQFSWKNTSASNKTISIVCFNYLPENRGTVNINIVVNGSSTSYPNRWLGGKVVYGGTPNPAVPAGCAPFFTRVTEKNRFAGGFRAAALVMDFDAMKGGIIWDEPVGVSQVLDFVPQLSLPYPSFAMLFEATGRAATILVEEASGYAFTQQDYYKCP